MTPPETPAFASAIDGPLRVGEPFWFVFDQGAERLVCEAMVLSPSGTPLALAGGRTYDPLDCYVGGDHARQLVAAVLERDVEYHRSRLERALAARERLLRQTPPVS